MPLLPESTAAFAKEDRYGFEAIDEAGRPVVVYVTREAIDETDAQAGRDPLAIIEKNRALLQWAAGAKWPGGDRR